MQFCEAKFNVDKLEDKCELTKTGTSKRTLKRQWARVPVLDDADSEQLRNLSRMRMALHSISITPDSRRPPRPNLQARCFKYFNLYTCKIRCCTYSYETTRPSTGRFFRSACHWKNRELTHILTLKVLKRPRATPDLWFAKYALDQLELSLY